MTQPIRHWRSGFQWLGIVSMLTVLGMAAWLVARVPTAYSSHASDINKDGVVDLADVQLFASQMLGQDWQTVDWCRWAADPGKYYEKHAFTLIEFVVAYFNCGSPDPLLVVNANNSPTRLAWGASDRLFVSDAEVGSVFIYERYPQLTLVGELKRLETPLGVAVDGAGNIFVGSHGRHQVEVYSAGGAQLAIIGSGQIQMPNALAFDQAGLLYVADSRGDAVLVFDPLDGFLVRTIGAGQLSFPVSLAISATEVFVADQGNAQIKVFDLQGNLLRTLGGPITGSFGYRWQGRFARLQSIALDVSLGTLHAADSQMSRIQVMDSVSGAYLADYGTKGSGPGQLDLPLDIAIQGQETAVANNLNRRIELLAVP